MWRSPAALAVDAGQFGAANAETTYEMGRGKLRSEPIVLPWLDLASLPLPREATERRGRNLVAFILRATPSELHQSFLLEVAYAAANAVAQNDLWLVAEVLQGWEADAEISATPQVAGQVNEALAEYHAGDKGRPWDEVARDLGLGGASAQCEET
jgi:hypothetical protein